MSGPALGVPSSSRRACKFFAKGSCTRGDQCRFSHSSSTTPLNEIQAPKIPTALQHCIPWKYGGCTKGEKCHFVHDVAIREAEQARQAEIAETEARAITQRTLMTSTRVTFGAGLAIKRVVTGFESASVSIRNLPLNANPKEVQTLLTQPGFDPKRFYVLYVRKAKDKSSQEACVVFEREEDGINAAAGLDGIEFRERNLKIELSAPQATKGQMGSSARDTEVLTISWLAPSVGVAVNYPSMEEAQSKARSLNGKECAGRYVRVEMNKPPPGRTPKDFVASSISINNLPPGTSADIIQGFAGSSSVKFLKGRNYDIHQSHEYFRHRMQTLGNLREYTTEESVSTQGYVSAQARFETWDQAKRAHDSLNDEKVGAIGGSKVRLRLPDPFFYTIAVPVQQFHAQETALTRLATDFKDNSVAHLQVPRSATNSARYAWIQVKGTDVNAVGALKVRVERLLAGERLDLWDQFFTTPEGSEFLSSIFRRVGVYVYADLRHKYLRVFGGSANYDTVHGIVEEKLRQLALAEYSVTLKRHSVKFFIREGLRALQSTIGENNVELDTAAEPARITVCGGEEVRHQLRMLISQSLTQSHVRTEDGQSCPVCFDDLSNPFRLACGQICCFDCMKHLVSMAGQTNLFPLTCVGGDGAPCKREIPIPVLQRFLPPVVFDRILEVAFGVYVDQHPQEFRHCQTADCDQIYRPAGPNEPGTILKCTSCLSTTCSSCHEDHEGHTCEAWRIHRSPAEQERLLNEWANGKGETVRACPSCKTLIEKNEGCNHMTCRCGAHICWTCMGVFPSSDIYSHLNSVHGGYIDLPVE